MKPSLVKCWICGEAATMECDYCGKPICERESCCKGVGGADPGIACTACFAILLVPQLATWEVRPEYKGGIPHARDD